MSSESPKRELTAQERKQRPLYSGVLKYFGDALMEVAYVSFIGNEQHNPGTPLHWDRSKSGDELDACARHLKDAGKRDSDGTRHSAKLAWRALANLQKEIEAGRMPKRVRTSLGLEIEALGDEACDKCWEDA